MLNQINKNINLFILRNINYILFFIFKYKKYII